MLSKLTAIVEKPKRRIGRGHGSGRVKTAGRGTKGQNARGTRPPSFEGGQLSLIKRLPLLRGKGKNKNTTLKAFPVKVGLLEGIPAKTDVTLATLVKYHMIEGDVSRVKILGGGALTHAVTVMVPCSKNARKAIEKAGGSVEA
jgi:large subunit ribosomal protein L15